MKMSESVIGIINNLSSEMRHPHNDGYIQCAMKQELWKIKMAVDRALKDAPEFTGEVDYRAQYVIEKLKGNV